MQVRVVLSIVLLIHQNGLRKLIFISFEAKNEETVFFPSNPFFFSFLASKRDMRSNFKAAPIQSGLARLDLHPACFACLPSNQRPSLIKKREAAAMNISFQASERGQKLAFIPILKGSKLHSFHGQAECKFVSQLTLLSIWV